MVIHTLVAFWILLAPPSPAKADPNSSCLSCHGVEGMTSEKGEDIYVDASKFSKGIHGSFTCTACHSAIKDYPHPKPLPKVDCSECHADVSTEFATSIHATARKNGDKDTPVCQTCHGPAHDIVPRSDPASRVAKKKLPETCGSCHANPEFLAKHNVPFARPVEAYRLSLHGRAVEQGRQDAPSCSDCHGSHSIVPARNPRSKINHWNVAATCGNCHTDIRTTYMESVHGQAMQAGTRDAPVCTDCHGEHLILAPSDPQSLVNPARVSTVTCGRCHSNERLEARYNLPTDRVPTFESSYHGLALREGSQTVANCASCHGVHNIFPSSDPRSTVSAKNLAATCGKCHAGAGTRFVIGPVHVSPASAGENPLVKWIRVTYLYLLIPFTVVFILLHNGLDFFSKLIRGTERHDLSEKVMRMNLHFRIAHWLIVLSFPTLVITGFALKYPDAWWMQPIVRLEGHFPWRGTIHRAAAIVLIASLVYHLIHLIRSRRDRVILANLLPKMKDVSDFLGMVRYNLGLTRDHPTFAMFNYVEKFEYWAFVWGTAVMTVSGLLLWFVNFTLRYFPKWFTDAATAIHFYEAVLATLAIVLWHFYFVMFDPDVYPMDRSWLTGMTSAEHLRETRPEYYLSIVSKAVPEMPQAASPKVSAGTSATSERDDAGKAENGDEDGPSPPKK